MRKFVRKLNSKPKYFQYMCLCLINLFFYFLMSVPAFFNYSEEARPLIAMAVYFVWFGFALTYGFCSIEIADSVVIGNLILALCGGFYCVICGNEILHLYEGTSVIGEFFSCTWYSMRYALGGAVVGFVGKNTR